MKGRNKWRKKNTSTEIHFVSYFDCTFHNATEASKHSHKMVHALLNIMLKCSNCKFAVLRDRLFGVFVCIII